MDDNKLLKAIIDTTKSAEEVYANLTAIKGEAYTDGIRTMVSCHTLALMMASMGSPVLGEIGSKLTHKIVKRQWKTAGIDYHARLTEIYADVKMVISSMEVTL